MGLDLNSEATPAKKLQQYQRVSVWTYLLTLLICVTYFHDDVIAVSLTECHAIVDDTFSF